MILTIVLWILVVLSGGLLCLGVVAFIQGATGKADPTDHGNIVVMRTGLALIVYAAPFGIAAYLLWSLTL